MSEPEAIIGTSTDRDGEARENRAARIARHLIDEHLLDMQVTREDDQRKLYYDPIRQQYWELVYEHTGEFGVGPPSLIPVSHDGVERLFGTKPIPLGDKVRLVAESVRTKTTSAAFEKAEEVHDQPVRIIHHLVEHHLIKAGAERRESSMRLYRNPENDFFYEIGIEHEREIISSESGGAVRILAGPMTLTNHSYAEIADLYGCIPDSPED